MSQKPKFVPRIVRPPKQVDLPPAPHAAPVLVPPGSGCPDCGAYMADPELHAGYHDRSRKWRLRVNEVLSIVLRVLKLRGEIPPDEPPREDAATDGKEFPNA